MLHGWLFPRFGATPARTAQRCLPLLACLDSFNLAKPPRITPPPPDYQADFKTWTLEDGAASLAPLTFDDGLNDATRMLPPRWLPADGKTFGWAEQRVQREEAVDVGDGVSFREVSYGTDMGRVAPCVAWQPTTLWLAAIDPGIDPAEADAAAGGKSAADAAEPAQPARAPRGLLTLCVLLPADAPADVDELLRSAPPTATGLAKAMLRILPEAEGSQVAALAIDSLGRRPGQMPPPFWMW